MWSAGCSSGEEVFSLTMTLLGPTARGAASPARHPHSGQRHRRPCAEKGSEAVTSATMLACPPICARLDQRAEASGDRPEARVWCSSSG
jgi:hypothetical protein